MKFSKKIGGFELHPVGIGTWMMGGDFYKEELGTTMVADYENDARHIKAIKYSIEKGQNHIDTAQIYGAGHTEELVGVAVKGFNREKLFLASKIWKSHLKRSAVAHAVEDMLKRMGIKYLDLIYVHNFWEYEPVEQYMKGLSDAVDRGLAKHIGVSNFNLAQLKKAVQVSKYPIAANQIHYNLAYQKEHPAALQKYCEKNNIMIVAYRPVARKLLADECVDNVVLDMANKYRKTPAQIALNWLICQKNVLAIPKASDMRHINENLDSVNFELTKSDWNVLKEKTKQYEK